MLQPGVGVAERRERSVKVGRETRFRELEARRGERVAKSRGGLLQIVVMPPRTSGDGWTHPLNGVGRLLEKLRRGREHRMVRRRGLRSGREQHQHARQLRRHLTQILKDRLACDRVANRAVIEQGRGLQGLKAKG